MANESIRFNVIIPTRERADTLYHCLRTVVTQEYENLNIIVSDNFSQDNTREIVASFPDSRIHYINPGKRLSMSHHWEFALRHATDGWVTFLGDDDGLLPGALAKIAGIIKETGCRAVTSKWCVYRWPTSTELRNTLIIPMTAGFEVRKSRTWLAKLLRGRAKHGDLPWLYTGGFADLGLVNSARDTKGQFFLSMIPDVYSAVALASVADNYVMLNEPVAVAGLSSHSIGTSQLGTGKNEAPARAFFSENNMPFHPKLGSARVPSLTILIYECYLQATHLHHDFLRIDLGKQLMLALSSSVPEQYETIRNYCDEVARRNGYPPLRISRYTEIVRLVVRLLSHLKPGLWRDWWRDQTATVNARRLNVTDIYAAALVANAIYVFHNQYSDWRWRKISALTSYVPLVLRTSFHKR